MDFRFRLVLPNDWEVHALVCLVLCLFILSASHCIFLFDTNECWVSYELYGGAPGMNMETMPKRRPGRPKSKTSIQSTTAKSAKTNQILRICINRLTNVNCYVGCTDSNKIKKEPADFKLDAICHGTELDGLEELIKRETQTNGNTEHKALDEEVENAEENNRVAPSEFSPCPYCTTSFTNPSYLEQHVKYHHREEYRGMVRRQSARQHPKAAPTHNCPQCVCVFHTSKQLTVHKNKAHPTAPPLKLYPCPTCARSFDYLRNLKNHCQRWHKMMVYMRDGEIRCSKCRKSLGKTWGQGPHKCTKFKSNASELENMKPISLVIGVQCSECGKTLGSPQSLAKHMVVHTGEKPHVCKDCGKAFSGLSSLRGHMLIHSGAKPYSCQVCGSSFPEMYRLRVHMGKHTGEKAFSCSECKKTFSFRGCLTRHLQTHFKVKCHFCPKCDKSFTSQDNLRYHLRIHNKSHQCGECGLKVSSFQVLKTHMRMHTDERPYHCKLCEKQFRRLEHLKNHQRTHSGEKPYKCDTCASSFSQSGDLAKHKRRHTGEKPFACSVCSKAFICSGALTLHMRIHSDERPFKCQECGMDFRTNPGLRSHKKIHTGERPYHCPHCEGRFKRLDHLKTHVGRCPNK